MNSQITTKLQERAQQNNLRNLSNEQHLVDFVSNDYLGLSRSKELFDKINNYNFEEITNLNGSTGSRLLAGNSLEAEKLEEKLAHTFKAEAALLFNSGYVANLALISSIPQKGDTIIYDSLSHVCLKEGAWLSKAQSYSFRHNDCNDLEMKLSNAKGAIYIIIESVYSMDGDLASFDEIIVLSKKYNANIIIDEAHSTGLYGENGSGKVCSLGIENSFFARVYTFGKAMGVHGACIVGSKELMDYLINFARPFIYTTALPVHSVFSIDAAFSFLKENIQLQNKSVENIKYFNTYFNGKIEVSNVIWKMNSITPIQPIMIPGNEKAKTIAHSLQKLGFDVRPILSPTVQAGSERLRVSIHTHNTQEEIKNLVDNLSSLL